MALARLTQGAGSAGSKLARLAQVAGSAGTQRTAGSSCLHGRNKARARQTQVAGQQAGSAPLHRASRQLFCTHLLVLQVPNMLRLVVDRDRLNLGVM